MNNNYKNKEKDKIKIEKNLKEIDKHLSELENNVEIILDPSTKQSQIKSKLANVQKEIDSLCKFIYKLIDKICIKDRNNFNSDEGFSAELEYFLEKNIFRIFIDYCCSKKIELIKIIIPYIERIITDCKDEIFLMNTGIISSIKVLIVTLLSLVKQSFQENNLNNADIDKSISELSNLVELIISFTYLLLNKIIIYPNFYASISVSEEEGKYFDTVIFDLVVELFSKEYLIVKREITSKIRKSILLCLNLENFYSEMNLKDVETLIQGLIKNLVEYYENFKNFENSLHSNKNKELMKKEKITGETIETLCREDIKSYLKFISIIIYCFSDINFKLYITKVFFQKFLVDCIQKDILNETKLMKLFEVIYYLTSIVKNKEISEKIFEFFFGTPNNNDSLIQQENNNYEDEESIIDIRKNMIDSLNDQNKSCSYEENSNNNPNFTIDIIDKKYPNTNRNYLSNDKIIHKITDITTNNNNNNLMDAIKIEIEKMEKENHKYEEIIAFLVKIIESNKYDLKILVINTINNIFQNSSKTFLTEILIPYYKTSMNPSNINELMFQYLKSNYEKIDIVEILKQIQQSFVNVFLEKWNQYFDLTLDSMYNKNIFLINHLSNKTESDFKFMDITSQTFYKNDFKPLNQSIVEDKTSLSTLSDQNNFSNEIKFKDLRTNFYEVLVKFFKNFVNNKFQENLFITKLFMTIYTIPNIAALNEDDFNLYNNINFSTNKKANYNFLSSIHLINHVSLKIDEEIKKKKYEKNVISKWVLDRYKEKELLSELENSNKKTDKKQSTFMKNDDSKLEFIDNVILFIEFYKEFVANLYMKCHFDYTSKNYSKMFTK